MLSNSGEKFAVQNASVSGDGRSFRGCAVEVSWHRLGCMSVMGVREKCDEKVGRKAAALGSVESQPFDFAQGRLWGTGLSACPFLRLLHGEGEGG